MQPGIEWTAEHLLRIADVESHLTVDLDELHAHQSPARTNHFLLGRTRARHEPDSRDPIPRPGTST